MLSTAKCWKKNSAEELTLTHRIDMPEAVAHRKTCLEALARSNKSLNDHKLMSFGKKSSKWTSYLS
jgi:hypothetical protein